MTQTAKKPQEYSQEVKDHYEDLPYPYVDPEKEGTFFSCNDAYSLMAFSQYGWEGKRDLRQGKTRILIGGCGTGASSIEFAEELLGTDAEIVAIDLSAKSIEIAKARMAKRGLNNVTFRHMSILDLPQSDLGEFDIIESSGVLHHLADPDAGLAALSKMLKPDGLMIVMVYAQYGRMSVYMVQDLMRRLMTPETPRADKILIAREFLNNVPQTHWLTVKNELFMADMMFPDGSGIYDLFLHSTDRAYTVPQIYTWLEGAKLNLVRWVGEGTDDSAYIPENYNASPILRSIFKDKSEPERHAIAELIHGTIAKHTFYAAKQPKKPAQFAEDMVMAYGPMQQLFAHFKDGFIEALAQAQIGQRLEGMARPFAALPPLVITKTPHVVALMQAIDGKRSIGEIVDLVAKSSGAPREDVKHNLEILYREYSSRQVVWLRHKSIPPYITGVEITERVRKFQSKA